MALSNNCKEKLSNMAVAMSGLLLWSTGVPVPTGMIEFLSKGGELALGLRAEQQQKCREIVAAVKDQVGAEYQEWLRIEHGGDWEQRADLNTALDEFNRIIHLTVPDAAVVVEKKLNGAAIAEAMIAAAAEHSAIVRDSEVAKDVFRTIIEKSFALVRIDDAFHNELVTASFEALLVGQEQLLAGQGAIRADIQTLRNDVLGSDGTRQDPSHIPANLPFGSIGTLFKGRDDFLNDIETALAGGAAAITGKGVVHGLGGVGKTRAAVEYALRHRDKYSALLFVPAKSPDDLRNNFAALCAPAVLNLPEQEAPQQDIRTAAARRWLAANAGWFLLFDNADTKEAAEAVEALIGNLHGGDILVTSRVSEWSGQVSTLPLDVLAAADAIALLLEATPRRRKADDDEDQAALLAEKLGFLSLAVTQAAAYINQRRMTIATYLEEWEKNRTDLLGWFDAQTMQYPQAVAATWETTFGQMSVPAQDLLNALAFCSHEPIPESLLDALPDEAKGKLDLHVALAELERFSFVSRDDDAPEFSVHRLVQQVARDRLDEDGKVGALTMALGLLQFATSGTNPQDVRDWPKLDPLQPHAMAACAAAPDNAQDLAAGLGHVLNEFGTLFYARAQHGQAEPLYRRSLEIAEKSYGPDHPDVAIDLNNLAELLSATNRLGEAEPLYRRSLAIDEKSFGPDHPDVARDLNNLAGLLRATNRLGEAEPLYRRALAIDEKSYGPDHPRVAIELNNLAGLLEATNRLGEAEPLYRRALAIDEKSYGPDHPDVARDLNNLAGLLYATNRLGEAEPLYRRALAIDEKSYGPDHPRVAVDLNNLAELLRATNRLGEAEPLYRRSLAIDEKSYGPDHPTVAIRLNNLAGLLSATNRLGEAEPLYRRSLAIDEKSYGPDHPDVARDLNNLAGLLRDTNRLGEAEPLYRRSLAIDEKSYGPDHPRVAIELNNLAGLLRDTNRLGEAEPLYRRSLAIDEKSYGPDHPTVARDLNNLAGLLYATNRLGEAEPLYRRALEIDEKSYGPDHPTVAIDLNNLAGLLYATNRLGEAEPLSKRHLLIFLKFTAATGHTHPHLAAAISNYSGLLQQLEKSEAETLAAITALFTEAGLDPAEWWPKIFGDGNKEPN